jgi:hypothetical protein
MEKLMIAIKKLLNFSAHVAAIFHAVLAAL